MGPAQGCAQRRCKACQCGKPRRLTAKEKQEHEILVQELIQEVGGLHYKDALLVASQKLRLTVTELIHEWDFEVEWQKEWGARDSTGEKPSTAAPSSTALPPKKTRKTMN